MLLLQATNTYLHFTSLFLVTLIRNLFSDLLPARLGTLVYIYIVNRRLKVPLSSAASSFTVCFFFDIIAVSILAVVISFCCFTHSKKFIVILIAGLLLLLFTYLIIFLLPMLFRQFGLLLDKLPLSLLFKNRKFKKSVEQVAVEIQLIKQTGIYGKIFTLSILVRIFKYMSLYLLFVGLIIGLSENIELFPFFKVIFGMISAELAASLPISGIAGFGMYEGTWALVFQLLGFSEKLSVITSVSHHLITQLYGYGLGALATLVLLLPCIGGSSFQLMGTLKATKTATSFFWIKVLLVIITVVAILGLLYPEMSFSRDSFQNKTTSYSLKEKKQLNIKGRLIYQRPDGIYSQSIDEREGKRILKGGKYPRWSNNGKKIVYISGKKIMIARHDGKHIKKIAVARKPRAVCFYPDGKNILFIDGKKIMIANIKSLKVAKFLEGYNFMELDISNDGKRVAVTVKSRRGYTVLLINLERNKVKTVAYGCSASLSPNGKWLTANDRHHKILRIFDSASLAMVNRIHAPSKNRFDNQKWSNDREWIVSTSEKNGNNIFIHRVSTDTAFKMTVSGDCDRGDLFIHH